MSFARYNPEDSVISAESIVRPMWSGDNTTLTNFFTPPGAFNTEYYTDIYQVAYDRPEAEVQFSVQYGHLNGSGSAFINPDITQGGYTPSRVVYNQYRNLVYGTETQNFSFDGGGTRSEQIYVININRSRYKQAINPGSLNLTLSYLGNPIRLTDDSNVTSLTRFIGDNRIFYIISGSNGNAFTNTITAQTTYYGMMLPDLGVIILDVAKLSGFIQPPDLNTDNQKFNQNRLINAISDGDSFSLQSQETISSRFFFTRVKNSEFNYTTNPSIIDANGNLLYSTLVDNPQTYITAVGMYNDNNELLAVAKLSKPLVKDFTKEALIRIKLDY
jgi:hypothetical protein